MQRCRFCGSEFPDNARFCENCGRPPASSPFASLPQTSMPPLGNQPGEDVEGERRRGAILPLAVPPWPEGSLAGGQVPLVQGTPSLSGVPTVQGTSSGIAGSAPPPLSGPAASAPPGVSPAGQPGTFEQHVLARTNPQVVHHDGSTGLQSHKPPEQEHQGKQHHQRQHHESRVHPGRHTAGSDSKAASGSTTKLILIAFIGLLVVAGGAAALVFASRSHSPNPIGTTPATPLKSTPTSSNHNASATACASSSAVPCSGTASPSSPVANGQSTGTFSFAGAVSGPLVITSFPACGMQGNTYVMQVIGTVGGTQYKFLIGILSYSGPGTYTSHLTVDLISGTGTSTKALANDGRLPVSITITNGGKAGTVSSDL